jgi:YbdK family carboxylate-amine ligase
MNVHAALRTASPHRDVGTTLGVEEEYHVVDAETFCLRDDHRLNTAALRGLLPGVHAEMATTQLEVATPICRTLADVRAELAAARAQAEAAAASVGATILVASLHPFGTWRDQRVTALPRYIGMVERWALLALQQVICGCHVHVGVPELDTAVAVMDRVRPYLPVVLALTGSSAFHEGTDTGYESYRTQWWSRWPTAGPSEPLGDAATYLAVVAELRATGVIDDASHLYWDVRPSLRYPTVEYRIADTCTSLDDAVLHAALVRSLTRVLAERAHRGMPAPVVRAEVLRAARWRAARYGVSGQLVDPVRGELVEAPVAVDTLLAELRDDLTDRGEWDEVLDSAQRVLTRGTSAVRQREVLHRLGSTLDVARMLVREGRVCPPAVV